MNATNSHMHRFQSDGKFDSGKEHSVFFPTPSRLEELIQEVCEYCFQCQCL